MNGFNTLTTNKFSKKTKTVFRKLDDRFLLQSTMIEKATFPYKIALSKASVKTNRMGSTKWTFHKERNFETVYFFFKT